MKPIRYVVIFFAFFTLSCANLFYDLSPKDTDKAKLFQAKLELDQSQWDDAITIIASMSATYQAKREVQVLKASAYAGRCGIDMLNLINSISNGTGTEKLFGTLMIAMHDATLSSVTDCITAETTLNAIGAAAARTVDENLLMTFVEFGKIGAILHIKADLDDDDVVDAGFDACDNNDLPRLDLDLPNDYATATQLVVALSTAVTSLQASGSTIAQSDLADLTAVCNPGGGSNICTATTAASVTDPMRMTMRAIVNANEVGLVVNNNDTSTEIARPCTGT
jgi:hypothetical protein